MATSAVSDKLWKTGDYSDLTIRCGSREWKVHKAVLCTQCEFFEAACNGRFKEAGTNTIEMHEDDPQAIELMLLALYGYNYAEKCAADTDTSLKCHASLVPISPTGAWTSNEFANAVDTVYAKGDTAGEQLKATVIKIIIDNATTLLHDEAGR
ncbi:hypothetical protein EJ03DRAFT_373569 [Teratosphaeria nubilosa]|uniref:BTB domain-containing protein n=1 Tax=Teratosphaeria nubilosa TaxID=161662 RepID=A0A6G1LCP6_9PEZI|nr:hypothetical protein EJ03DRAFT_373569 [Teratosphaeria nubilosa]